MYMFTLFFFLFLFLTYFVFLYFFFFNDTATTEIYTLSLHDALPIFPFVSGGAESHAEGLKAALIAEGHEATIVDRKSTRLNSSHGYISYAVFCLKKKKNKYVYLLFDKVDEKSCVDVICFESAVSNFV